MTQNSVRTTKPLGMKAYGHIPHLPGSRLGPGDHCCEDGQARIACERARDRYDRVTVTEKLDGSCVAVAKLLGQIVPLVRSGYVAWSSPYEQHHLFGDWVLRNWARFDAALPEGWRLVGEWLAQAHGTRYDLPHEPFVAFDLMRDARRAERAQFLEAAGQGEFVTPRVLHEGGPIGVDAIRERLEPSGHGALDPVEGAVWRVERPDAGGKWMRVDFLCKWVRADKQDGRYLPEASGEAPVWNWRPGDEDATDAQE